MFRNSVYKQKYYRENCHGKSFSLHCLTYLKLKKKSLKILSIGKEIPSPEMSVNRQDKKIKNVMYDIILKIKEIQQKRR